MRLQKPDSIQRKLEFFFQKEFSTNLLSEQIKIRPILNDYRIDSILDYFLI